MATSTGGPSYDVFLSYRGEIKNFADHLYTALAREGIFAFIDDNREIQVGENIELAFQKAIQGSKISIVVFSEDYAASTWCLKELFMVMERKKLDGHIVLPAFYYVDPPDVRNQRGSFAEAFARHEHVENHRDKVEGWRRALREIAELKGFLLRENGLESQLIQSIVEEVVNRLRPLSVASYLVGTDSRIALINSWLQDRSDDVGIATLCGMGGIGKTTISKIVYNQNFNKFDGGSFVANVREISKQPNGLIHLQRQVLTNILKRKADKIYSVDEGIIKIKDAVCNKRILLILDDVDQLDQFHAIIGNWEWFHSGSKIVITTRLKNLLRTYEVNLLFEVQKLDDNESLQLFNWHAFRQVHTVHGYENDTGDVVQYCCGLPFALEVLGSYLCGRTANEWESSLQKLKQIPHPTIQKVLRTSYDSLQDDHDKCLFLHMACFFTGMDKDYAIRILDGFNFHTAVGIQNLMDRCLLTTNEENKLIMHPLLRDLGREIAHQESLVDPRKFNIRWMLREVTYLFKHKVTLEWIFVLTNLILETLLVTFDQIASPKKPQYSLVTLILSLAAMLICIIELVAKGQKKNVGLKRQGLRCWFHCTFIDVFSFLCAISQCVFASVAYSYLRRGEENQIKVSIVSLIFIICLAASKLVNNQNEAYLPLSQNNERRLSTNHID